MFEVFFFSLLNINVILCILKPCYLNLIVCNKMLCLKCCLWNITKLFIISLKINTENLNIKKIIIDCGSESYPLLSIVGIEISTCHHRVFRRNATHCISPYAIVVRVCLCVCMPRLWTSGKWLEIDTSFLF